MQILPVIDLMRGLVVRGIAGQRESYRPISSRLSADPRPGAVARAFAAEGVRACYVADLDAIAGEAPSWSVYRELVECGLRLWVDAGCGDAKRAGELAAFEHQGQSLGRLVIGLESLETDAALGAIIALVGGDRLVFSLDLKNGEPITRPGVWPGKSAWEIARHVTTIGVHGIIVLDLAAVGTYDGPATLELCQKLRATFPTLEIISGGGVRGPADVRAFLTAGCDFVLVASALHDGRMAITLA